MITKLPWRLIIYQFSRSHQFLPLRSFSNQQNPASAQQSSYMRLTQSFYRAIKERGSIPIAQKLHGQLISSGLDFSVFLQNHLLNMYFNCGLINDAFRVFAEMGFRNVVTYNTMISGLGSMGRIRDAKELFDEMPDKDSISWNSMMSGYFRNGKPEEALGVFISLIRDFTSFTNLLSFSCAMKACGALGYIKLAFQLHGLVEKINFGNDTSIETSIMDMYIKCDAASYAELVFLRIPNPNLFCFNSMIYGYSKFYGVGKALNMFNQMPERDSVSWNTMISILSRRGFGVPTLTMFVEMWTQGFRPNSKTYACVLSTCATFCYLEWGTHLHARIVRTESIIDVYVGNGLIDMYAKCGNLEFARRAFNSLTEHNSVTWTSLIGGVAQCGLEGEALVLFNQMRKVPVALDEFTLTTVLKVCSFPNNISVGKQLHALTIKAGMDSFVSVGNALIKMYSKCGDCQEANYAFEMMSVSNIISWTSMITAFSQVGDVEKAQACFDEMLGRNVITWNSMISMYLQHGFWERGLKFYLQMQKECIIPDDATFATLISGCADLAMLKLGTQIIAQAEKFGFGSDVSVANSVITMYSKCGQIENARKVFDSISMKDLVSWNSMMSGYAQNGQGRIVIEIFQNMLKMGYTPDSISYVSLLSGCSYSGLVTEGKHYFESMTKDYGILPAHEHFACMVDLLGRAGLLEQAKDLIDEMPFKPNADVWGALLGACKIHCNPKLAELAVRNLLELNVDKSGSYMLLAHVYSECGKLEGVANVRKLMREKRIQMNPSCSWIEVNNRVHIFTVDEANHPQINDIYAILDDIHNKIEDTRSCCAVSSTGS
ncbi:pentatricopeptide repeat-containing protein At2g13600 [Manihot esculenta]|uniref:Uncharacterized protein n=1 Tax=Manihot esculenta TaxID=3983 RepID=A0ACB7HPD9_MANES|nr:pentatricopeptide repeat-containing protein At2g13600 [Manihot esculenta]XP_043813075.1 pentatricopeptide repeat-containing protein At2g13600 [Manihot esculenta]XP_043813076.1 pentatricopeptide repeat-containing protein At2g13600 [Manihot esculenta]XP_043813077.1 pentatricopeptide repeat-containing protein At2g13600 [Manihot esculenta]XP_043813078.1 pentatricopeptide repeat-containing protein At2g13600 [Manihot esculenta]XP_043813079.1 pentatricopeptide repeat-containing protein At2g13600 [